MAAALALVGGALVLPACSTSDEAAPACANGTKDEGEDGIDCGGACAARCTGVACAADAECVSGHCVGGACAAPAGKPCGVGAAVATCADGEACELDKDCASGFCGGASCAEPPAGSHTDGKKNGGETGIDCGGTVKTTQPCPDGQTCTDNTDCVGTCTASVCGPMGPADGKKNGDETDVDCGGAVAPKCKSGKACAANADCTDDYCPEATHACTAPRYDDGVLNGTETDVDCGGTGAGMVTCAQGKTCKADTDCNGACNYASKCMDMPSCKRQHGGDTCGGGDVGNGQAETHATATDPNAPGHEDCCRTLPVAGYTDPTQPGKTVYVDKYEITAGRMRAFLEAIGGGADPVLPAGSTNPKPANVRAWIAAHKPARWNDGWDNVLPQGNVGSNATYVVKSPTTDLQYPGQDVYSMPATNTQGTTWYIRATGPTDTAIQQAGQQGTYTIDTSVFKALNSTSFFPEYRADPSKWAQGEYYAEGHALNCSNADQAYGWSTFWMDAATIAGNDMGLGKAYPEDLMDEKSMNCAPNALFAAFCAWDGGQLATAEVMDAISGNTVEAAYVKTAQNGKLASAGGNQQCGAGGASLNTFADGTQGCYNVWYYPSDGNTHDDSGKVAMPGRVAADRISSNPADEPWMDMIGNLQEVVMKRGETNRFDYRGFGLEFSSIQNHKTQQSTPRFRGGAFGARCMRFR
ncbi:MAG: hypothetical protein JWP97_2419 [Labilithrix sp.]|nr:hypothetical protein [Labilithrix sp.]